MNDSLGTYDVAVIGGRTTGSYLASAFAEQDYDVLLVEKEDVPGESTVCSGHYSEELWRYVPNEIQELVQNEITGARFHTADDIFTYWKDKTVSWVVDRNEMDRKMFEHATEHGADGLTGTRLASMGEHDDRVGLELEQGGDELYAEAKIVAGCDGASSTVRQEAGIEQPETTMVGILGVTGEDDPQDFVDVYLEEIPGAGFGWRIPRGEHGVEYGVFVEPQPGINATEVFREVTDRYAPYTPDLEASSIPILPSKTATSDRSFLVGDAAGQVKPFTGGGIVYGLQAATIAAETVDPNRPETLLMYDSQWKDELYSDIHLGEHIRQMYDRDCFLRDTGMQLLEGDISEVHMDRPSSLPRHVFSSLTKLF